MKLLPASTSNLAIWEHSLLQTTIWNLFVIGCVQVPKSSKTSKTSITSIASKPSIGPRTCFLFGLRQRAPRQGYSACKGILSPLSRSSGTWNIFVQPKCTVEGADIVMHSSRAHKQAPETLRSALTSYSVVKLDVAPVASGLPDTSVSCGPP